MSLLRAVWALIVQYRAPLIRVILPLYVVGAVLFAYANMWIAQSYFGQDGISAMNIRKGMLMFFLLLGLAGLGQVVLAVIWHRAALEEDGGLVTVRSVARYVGAGVLIFLVFALLTLVCVQLPGWLLFTVFSEMAFSPAGQLVFRVVSWATYLFGFWLWLRMGLILPAAALNDEWVGLGESVTLTAPWSGALWVVAAVQAALTFVMSEVLYLPGSWAVETVVWLLFWPLVPLLGLATLTWMYREVDQQTRRAA